MKLIQYIIVIPLFFLLFIKMIEMSVKIFFYSLCILPHEFQWQISLKTLLCKLVGFLSSGTNTKYIKCFIAGYTLF